jgi:hypothetical protein
MTEGLSHEYPRNVFIPYIQQHREKPVFADKLGDLLMDSVGAQFTVAGRKQNHCSCFPGAYD